MTNIIKGGKVLTVGAPLQGCKQARREKKDVSIVYFSN